MSQQSSSPPTKVRFSIHNNFIVETIALKESIPHNMSTMDQRKEQFSLITLHNEVKPK